MKKVSCRAGCGACCIAPSLSSSVPGMEKGKPAGVRCAQLTPDNNCGIYDRPDRPAVCGSYEASREYCGENREDALKLLGDLELITGS